ncbi:MAG: thiamine ABC transporter substrate-binding protein [Candidatus Micrarchaeota archaeon]
MRELLKIGAVMLIIASGAILITSIQSHSGKGGFSVATISPGDRMPISQASKSTPLPANEELVIYTYDGITSDWGLGPKIFPIFEEECNCHLKVVAKGDVGEFVARLIYEKGSPEADIALGIDNTFRERVEREELLDPYRPSALESIDSRLLDGDYRFIPFDWGYLAFVYDSKSLQAPPTSLEDLASGRFRKKIILEDARTSSPGRVFLYWVASEYGNNTADYLERLEPNILTITPGWSEAYNLFLQGEAPIVLSYSTSPAYHFLNENTSRYKAAIFPKMYRQVEYVGIVKGARHRELAERFVEFMLSERAQAQIPLGNFMYPSRLGVPLPEAFQLVVEPGESWQEIGEGDKWLEVWEGAYSN